jgi:hypothetical protein
MAVLNLSVTVPDDQIARLQAAARAQFGQVPNGSGGFRDMTPAEIQERIRQDIISTLKQMTRRHERQTALLAAEASVILITAS